MLVRKNYILQIINVLKDKNTFTKVMPTGMLHTIMVIKWREVNKGFRRELFKINYRNLYLEVAFYSE